MRCERTGGYCKRPECIRAKACSYYVNKTVSSNSPSDNSFEIISGGAMTIIDTVDRPYHGGGGSFGGGGSSSSWSDSSSSDSGSSSSSD